MILRSILSVPGSAKSIEDIYRGGRLLAVVLPNTEGKPPHEKFSFSMDGPDRDLCKTALNHAITKEVIPNSEYMVDICESLGFVSVPTSKKSV